MEDQVREAASVLVVDDHPAMRDALVRSVAINGTEVLAAADGTEALAILRERPVAVVVTDLKMPGVDGLGLLKAVKLLRPDSEVVLVTAHGQVADAVQAIKDGAYDFITKPFEPFAIRKLVARGLERHALRAVNRSLAAELATLRGPGQIVGSSQAMRRVLEMVRQVAPSTSTILIQGESGTGKELIADAIHQLSPRREDPFIKVNCAALPDTLLESELFGYERGAFTGAVARKEGRFELAHGGTLFLDEVADMAPATQAKLLRALQEGTFERLGGTKTITVDVRVVAATNRDLRRAMEEGTFREDLFYRLNVIAILLPPLRDRGEDLPLLAQHFLSIFSSKNGKQITAFTPEAMAVMVRYRWPGNVRELENAIERAVVLDRDGVLGVEDLPDAVRGGPGNGARSALTFPIGTPLEEIERRVIAETLDHCKNDKTLAARLLGISSRTIYRKIEEQGASK